MITGRNGKGMGGRDGRVFFLLEQIWYLGNSTIGNNAQKFGILGDIVGVFFVFSAILA